MRFLSLGYLIIFIFILSHSIEKSEDIILNLNYEEAPLHSFLLYTSSLGLISFNVFLIYTFLSEIILKLINKNLFIV